MQTVRAADTNEVDKLIFRESDNDRKVSCAAFLLPHLNISCITESLLTIKMDPGPVVRFAHSQQGATSLVYHLNAA